jgi:nucleoside-diphosphate kinase
MAGASLDIQLQISNATEVKEGPSVRLRRVAGRDRMPLNFDRSSSPSADQPHSHLEPCMAVERTLSIIKPDAVAQNVIGKIYRRFESLGLRIIAARMLHLSRDQAERFYEIHRERPFYQELVAYMTSGPVMVQVLEGDDAITKNREIMGATDPKKAAPGTLRAEFAESITRNAVHGSDAPDTAALEIAFFFGQDGLCPRTL